VGFTYQTYPIVGGTVLIIERVQSQNYVAGVSGWAIEADGDAEFNNLVARGELLVGSNPGRHVRIYVDTTLPFNHIPTIELSTGSVSEAIPATITTTGVLDNPLQMFVSGPKHATGNQPSITFTSNAGGTSEMVFLADVLQVFAPITFDTGWAGFTASLIWAGTWTDVAGARAGYFKDATGRVQLRGIATGGGAALIGTLPAGNRPTQTMEWVMRGQGGVVLCAVQVATNGQMTVTANAATAQANGIRLDSISFPAAF
jgi:hypothetical protein